MKTRTEKLAILNSEIASIIPEFQNEKIPSGCIVTTREHGTIEVITSLGPYDDGFITICYKNKKEDDMNIGIYKLAEVVVNSYPIEFVELFAWLNKILPMAKLNKNVIIRKDVLRLWDLDKPFLYDQSDELIDFLLKILDEYEG